MAPLVPAGNEPAVKGGPESGVWALPLAERRGARHQRIEAHANCGDFFGARTLPVASLVRVVLIRLCALGDKEVRLSISPEGDCRALYNVERCIAV